MITGTEYEATKFYSIKGDSTIAFFDYVPRNTEFSIKTTAYLEDIGSRIGRIQLNKGTGNDGIAIKHPGMSVRNLGTGLIVYSASWLLSGTLDNLTAGDIKQLMPSSSPVFVYHASSKFLMVTCYQISEDLHRFLTMI